jgi:hypothetical protein
MTDNSTCMQPLDEQPKNDIFIGGKGSDKNKSMKIKGSNKTGLDQIWQR